MEVVCRLDFLQAAGWGPGACDSLRQVAGSWAGPCLEGGVGDGLARPPATITLTRTPPCLPPPRPQKQILPEFFKHFWVRRMALDRRNYRALVETTVEVANKVGGWA